MDLIQKYLQEKTDTGWKKTETDRKDQYGNRIKNVARRLARQGMQSAIKDLKKGPEAGKRQVEEVEELDELKEPTIQKYITRAKFSSDPKRRAMAKQAQSKLQKKQNPMKTEEVEKLYETKAKEPLYHFQQTIASILKKHPDANERNKLAKHHADAMKKSNPKFDHEGFLKAAGVMKEELEETESKLYNKAFDKYADSFTKKGKTTPEKQAMYKKMAQNAYKMLPGKSVKPNLPEEVEELEELKRSTLASYTGKAADQMAHAAIDKSTGAAMGTMGRMSDMPDLAKKGSDKEDKAFKTILKRSKGISSASRRLAKEEAELEEELSPSQRDTHFSLMNKHSLLAKSAKGANKDAHRMAALDHQMALRNPDSSQRSSKALSLSKKLGVKEDSDIISKYTKLGEAKYPGFRVRMTPGVSKLPRRGYGYVPQGDTDPRTGLPLGFSPAKEEPKKQEPTKKTK